MTSRRFIAGRSPRILFMLLLGAMPACANQSAQPNPEAVKQLIADHAHPLHYESKFEPVPEEELAELQLPERSPYQLGIGDGVQVRITNDRPVTGYESPVAARVREDGAVRLPQLGRVAANKISSMALEDEIAKKLVEAKLITKPEDVVVDVEITEYVARQCYVVGEVGEPSTIPVNNRTTLLQALIQVGATNHETADRMGESYIVRNGQALPFTIASLLEQGHPMGRAVLQADDVVYVPHIRDRQDYIYVFGEVGSPKRILMTTPGPRGSMGELTLAGALAEAGGLNPRADISDITIYRDCMPCPRRWKVSIADVYSCGHEIELRPGDRIAVGTSASANFADALGPVLQLVSGSSSLVSLGLSAAALADNN